MFVTASPPKWCAAESTVSAWQLRNNLWLVVLSLSGKATLFQQSIKIILPVRPKKNPTNQLKSGSNNPFHLYWVRRQQVLFYEGQEEFKYVFLSLVRLWVLLVDCWLKLNGLGKERSWGIQYTNSFMDAAYSRVWEIKVSTKKSACSVWQTAVSLSYFC